MIEVYTGTFNKGVLKCSACSITLESQLQYKEHYKTEFHRYNIKRKTINLPPATYEQFQSKKGETIKLQPESFVCTQCKKTFNSEATFNQHVTSKKHSQVQAKEDDNERKSQSVVENKPKNMTQLSCLFCRNIEKALQGNIKHMNRVHGFFISQEQYCCDKTGLIKYLHEKVQIGLMCLFCENKGKDFTSGESVRNHMKDKGHTFMFTDKGFEEYQKYYDFSALFDEKLEQQKKYKKLTGIQAEEIQVIDEAKANNGQDEDDWQSDNDESGQIQEAIEQQKIIKQQSRKATSKYVIYKPTVTRNEQLLLPSGRLLGHRKYRHLYKQYFRPHYIDLRMKQIMGDNYTGGNALSKRYFEIEHLKRDIVLKPRFHRNKVTELNQKVKQNRLQYFFRVQNPK